MNRSDRRRDASGVDAEVRRPRRRLDERGSVSFEMVLILPAVILTLVAVVQVALYAHASNLVDSAAREGARSARLSGDLVSGEERAGAFLERFGDQMVSERRIETSRDGDTIAVRVTGKAPHLIPGMHLVVSGRSTGRIEQFTAVTP